MGCGHDQHGYGHAGVHREIFVATGWDARIAQKPDVLDGLTKWYPLGRVATPGDIAKAVTFLASEDAAFISGVTLPVDGGLSCRAA